MSHNPDVVIIGAGAGGPVVAKELGEKGIRVMLLEAGPWYGNKKWPNPNLEQGALGSGSTEDLSSEILHNCFTDYEGDMNNTAYGKFRWGPADRSRNSWFRLLPKGGFAWQSSGVGGTTLHYFGNSPRAFPAAVDDVWPISYRELIPYYEQVEATLPVSPAPMTAKEELFFYGAKKAGWQLLKGPDVTSHGYRPHPNAILPPPADINNSDFRMDGTTPGCTLRGHCINGCHTGPTIEKTAKRSTLVSYIPLALKTGFVEVRPNSFAIKILTENHSEGLRAVGVRYRNTWTGEEEEIRAQAVVMAAGCVETPRLWLNSQLPDNAWVGKGMTTHYFDCLSGIFDEQVLLNILGQGEVKPYVGQNSAARFDYPGLGVIQALGVSPGLTATLLCTMGKDFNIMEPPNPHEPWEVRGRVVGHQLKEMMAEYPRTLSVLLLTDDTVSQSNGVSLHPILRDEHGQIPVIEYYPENKDKQKRDKLAVIAADILRKAGAKRILRSDSLPQLLAHMEGTMRMGYVTDTNCEAYQVKRLFVADNSVHYNCLGGPNPTLTTQALAARTAEKLATKYFS